MREPEGVGGLRVSVSTATGTTWSETHVITHG